MRDSEILQAKTAVRLLSGMRDDNQPFPVVRCPNPTYVTVPMEERAEKA